MNMPELIIKYKNKRTLDALLDFAKYFDFSVIIPSKKSTQKIKGVTIVHADSSIELKDIEQIFSNRNLNSKQLREHAWQRTK